MAALRRGVHLLGRRLRGRDGIEVPRRLEEDTDGIARKHVQAVRTARQARVATDSFTKSMDDAMRGLGGAHR